MPRVRLSWIDAVLRLRSPDDGEGAPRGEGDGSSASAVDSGGVLPGSAQEVGNVLDDDGNAERSSPDASEVQAVLSKCTEGSVVSGDCILSGDDSKASGTHNEIQAVSSDQHLDDTSLLAPDHGDGAGLSSEFLADEINKSSVISLETVASSSKDGIGHNEDEFSCLENQNIVEEDSSHNNSGMVYKEQIPCEETLFMEQSRVMFTTVDDVSNSTIKEPVNLLGDDVSRIEKLICPDDTSGDDLSQLASSGSHSEAPDVVKPQQQADSASLAPDQLIIPKEMGIDEGLHCPDADVNIKALSSAVEHADEDISAVNHTNNVSSPHYTADDIQDNVRQTSDITLMPSQADRSEVSTSSTSHEIDKVSSQSGIDETSPNVNLTSHEVNEVHGIDIEEIPQNEDIIANNDSQGSNRVCGTHDIEENTPNKEIIAEASSHKTTTVQSTYNVEEKEQIEEFESNSTYNKINEIRNLGIEETKQSDVVEISDKINVVSNLENVQEEQRNKETIADPSIEISVANLPSSLELSKLDVETTTQHTAYEPNTVNVTENVDEIKLNEEITIDPTSHINMICSTTADENKKNEEMSDGPSPDEIIVPRDKFNLEENIEETMPGPTSDKINNVVGTSDIIEVKSQNQEVTSGTSDEDDAIRIHTTANVEEKKGGELISDPASYKLDVESTAGNVEEKVQTEDTRTDPSSHESDMLHIIDDAESKEQDTEITADHAAEKIDMPHSTDDAEEKKQETVSTDDFKGDDNQTESNTPQIIDDAGNKKQDAEAATADPASGKTQGTADDAEERKQEDETVSTADDPNKGDDQNEEEIADKEVVIVNSDKNHISLKSLLSERAAETREKKPSTKDRVLSFRRRASKDGASPAKPEAVPGQQDWNSPARLPVEKKPKGKKQQWVPFICCPSLN
uniref:Uncharacterized protein n=1 Tax=Oryza brachyantha TaxID=4533 RepID=J3MUL2_ORYBR